MKNGVLEYGKCVVEYELFIPSDILRSDVVRNFIRVYFNNDRCTSKSGLETGLETIKEDTDTHRHETNKGDGCTQGGSTDI
jgi:hypothetical protein